MKGVMSKVKDRMMATVLGVMVLMMARMMTDLWMVRLGLVTSVVLRQGNYDTTMDGDHGVDDGQDDDDDDDDDGQDDDGVDGAPLAATGAVYGLPSGRLKKQRRILAKPDFVANNS